LRVLVLGGTRFIGRRLVEALLARGHKVTLFNRGRTLHPFGNRTGRVVGERKSAADLARAAHAGRDAVFDFLSYDAEDARLAVEAFAGRTAHFVHISTCSVYWCTGDFPCPVSEEAFDGPRDFDERPGSIEYAYGFAKRKAEEVLFAARAERGFPLTAIRMPIVGGEADPSLRYISYFHRIDDGRPLVLPDSGAACFRHMYVGDAAETLADLPGKAAAVGRAYNLACEEILDLRRVVAMSAELLGRKAATVPIPMEVLDARGLDRSFSPFSQPASQVPAIGRAKAELGYRPTPHADWLARTVRWYRDTYRAGPPPQYAHREKEIEVMEAYVREVGLRVPGPSS
jgi:nucleoside-diphosphate-sugar epimerase